MNGFINLVQQSFQEREIDNCVNQSNLKIDFIQDDAGTQAYFTHGIGNGFKIINPNQKDISLFSLDGCFFTDSDGKRCDGIVFDKNELCLFELKFNVTSRRGIKKRERYNDAIEQLGATITFFNNVNQNILKSFSKSSAYICMPTQSYPRNPATKTHKKVAFLEKYGVKLFDKNEKEFY